MAEDDPRAPVADLFHRQLQAMSDQRDRLRASLEELHGLLQSYDAEQERLRQLVFALHRAFGEDRIDDLTGLSEQEKTLLIQIVTEMNSATLS